MLLSQIPSRAATLTAAEFQSPGTRVSQQNQTTLERMRRFSGTTMPADDINLEAACLYPHLLASKLEVHLMNLILH